MKQENLYWLIKSEPSCYSIDDMKKDKKTRWSGVRNFQARNFMRDLMKKGDKAIFYHSGANPPAAVGEVSVSSLAIPEESDRTWVAVEFMYNKKFKNEVTLPQIKFDPKLKGIMVAQVGSRLSIQPISRQHFEYIVKLGTA
jgi:predicted RNA-binding protein with PUA-like domain